MVFDCSLMVSEGKYADVVQRLPLTRKHTIAKFHRDTIEITEVLVLSALDGVTPSTHHVLF